MTGFFSARSYLGLFFFFSPRNSTDSIFVIGGEPEPCTRVQEFLVRERCWRERASLIVGRRKGHATAVVRVAAAGGEETLIGVFGGWGPLSDSEVYDVREDSWHRLPDLREKRYAPAAASVPGDSRMFVFGGRNDSIRLASVEYCQFGADWRERTRTASSADFWQPAAPMRTARQGLAATALRGGILVAGGNGACGNSLNVVELFSLPDANHLQGQWTEVAGMQKSRAEFTLLTSDSDTVFALGSMNLVKVFSLPEAIHEWSQCTHIGQFCEPDNTVETLTAPDDPKSWVWSLKNPLETFRWIEGAGIIRV